MVRITKKKEIESVRAENEVNVENKYENVERNKEDGEKLGKGIDMVHELMMNNMQNEGRKLLTEEEVIVILNTLFK
jgi:hypothetical protein